MHTSVLCRMYTQTYTHEHIYLRNLYRWVRAFKKRMPIPTREPVEQYASNMGFVDRFDKNSALSRIRLKRSMRRYHRVIFMWYICVVLNNMMALMVFIFLEFENFQRAKEAKGFGYRHFYQNELGNVLIVHGLKLAGEFWTHWAAVKVDSFARGVLVRLRMKKLRSSKLPRQRVFGGVTVTSG